MKPGNKFIFNELLVEFVRFRFFEALAGFQGNPSELSLAGTGVHFFALDVIRDTPGLNFREKWPFRELKKLCEILKSS